MNRHADQIIRELQKVSAIGADYNTIFDDWLEIVHAALSALPRHLRSARETGMLAEDTPEVQQLYQRLNLRYHRPYCWQHFHTAFHILLNSAQDDWNDTIGDVYMDFGIANKRNGQFFTPYTIAALSARLTTQNGEMLYQHLTDAYLKSPYGLIHSILVNDPARIAAFVRSQAEHLVPLVIPHFDPIRVSDCACGSGVMLLAAAETFPRWALNWGLVAFYGQDIDHTCVRMAQVNMMLHGLNGFSIKCALALTTEEITAVPEPYQSAYAEACQAQATGNLARVDEITAQVAGWRQMPMFSGG